jgi:hypothetical protein
VPTDTEKFTLLTDGTFTLVNDWRICVRCSLLMFTELDAAALELELELAPAPLVAGAGAPLVLGLVPVVDRCVPPEPD